jgi:hypothetical protein
MSHPVHPLLTASASKSLGPCKTLCSSYFTLALGCALLIIAFVCLLYHVFYPSNKPRGIGQLYWFDVFFVPPKKPRVKPMEPY